MAKTTCMTSETLKTVHGSNLRITRRTRRTVAIRDPSGPRQSRPPHRDRLRNHRHLFVDGEFHPSDQFRQQVVQDRGESERGSGAHHPSACQQDHAPQILATRLEERLVRFDESHPLRSRVEGAGESQAAYHRPTRSPTAAPSARAASPVSTADTFRTVQGSNLRTIRRTLPPRGRGPGCGQRRLPSPIM